MTLERVPQLNEESWERCNFLWQFVEFLSPGSVIQPPLERRCRLMVVAGLRAVWSHIIHPWSKNAVEVAERSADDPDPIALATALTDAERACEHFADYDFEYFATPHLSKVAGACFQAVLPSPLADIRNPMLCWGDPVWTLQSNSIPGRTEAEAVALHLRLLHDIFGNPFRPVAFAPEWRTDTAVALARTMYESRDFSGMPILADALQDVGCDNDDILAHCRDENQVHVRGCWVCDLVLGRE